LPCRIEIGLRKSFDQIPRYGVDTGLGLGGGHVPVLEERGQSSAREGAWVVVAGFEATVVEDGATVGANATLLCGLRLGRGAFVSAGAVVLDAVPPFALVAGVPARRVGWACLCGEPLGDGLDCAGCGRRYRRAGEGLEPDGREPRPERR